MRDRQPVEPSSGNKIQTDEKKSPAWLICAATRMELDAICGPEDSALSDRVTQDGDLVFATTGVGIPFTFARLLPLTQRLRPARILNIGIAGAYPNSGYRIGDIVIGRVEAYGDLGFELPEEPGFQSLIESGMGSQMEATSFPLLDAPEWNCDPEANYQADYGVHRPTGQHPVGCTVNACAGTEHTGLLRERLFSAQFETMEGAAVAQVGFITGIPVCEVRAISNIAARRDMRPENIRLALHNLRHYLQACRDTRLL